MATIDWPGEGVLPQGVRVEGFSQQARSNTIRTKIPAGVDKVRQRYSTPIVNMNCSILLTHTEYESLESFYNTTLQGGVERFNFDDPVTGDTYDFRFVSPPTYTPVGPLYYNAALNLERL